MEFRIGQTLSGVGVAQNTTIVSLGSVTYTVNNSQTVVSEPLYGTNASFTGSISGTTLTATAIDTGFINIGDAITGANVTANTVVTGFGAATYTVSNSQTVGSRAMTGIFDFTQSFSLSQISGISWFGSTTYAGNYITNIVPAAYIVGGGAGTAAGYHANDVLTLTAATGSPTITVETVDSGGGILTYHVSSNVIVPLPSNPIATTGGAGAGATFNVYTDVVIVGGGGALYSPSDCTDVDWYQRWHNYC